MTDYTQNITFATKDALSTGDPAKVIKGSDIDGEFSEIETASATKLDKYAAVTELTALDDTADMLSVYDNDATAYKRITVANARPALHPANGCFVNAYLTSNQSVNDISETDITGYTETSDIGGDFNATTGVFTAPATGTYLFSVNVTFSVSGALTAAYVTITDSSNTDLLWVNGLNVTGSSVTHRVNGSGFLEMTASDTAKMRVYRKSGEAQDIFSGAENTWFQVVRVK